jgi:excisionase family DNA binding protein
VPALTTRDVAEQLAVTERTVRNWIVRDRTLAAIVLGPASKPRYRIEEAELERFIRQRRRPCGSKA